MQRLRDNLQRSWEDWGLTRSSVEQIIGDHFVIARRQPLVQYHTRHSTLFPLPLQTLNALPLPFLQHMNKACHFPINCICFSNNWTHFPFTKWSLAAFYNKCWCNWWLCYFAWGKHMSRHREKGFQANQGIKISNFTHVSRSRSLLVLEKGIVTHTALREQRGAAQREIAAGVWGGSKSEPAQLHVAIEQGQKSFPIVPRETGRRKADREEGAGYRVHQRD